MITHNATQAMLLMLLGIAALVAMDATVKLLVTDDIHAIQLIALRSLIIAPILYFVFRLRGEQKQLVPHRVVWQLLRAVVGFIAASSFFTSLVYLPQADVTVIFFGAPLIITLCSVLFLGETFGTHRWVAVIVGFLGVAIALKPEGGVSLYGYFLACIGTLAYATLFLSGRYLSKTETTASLVMTFNIGVGFIGLVLLPWVWTPMDKSQWLVLVLLAVLAVIGHYLITAAFAKAQASLLSPIEYTALFWAVLYDWLLWQTAVNLQTITGGAIVILAGLYFLQRERISASNTSLQSN